MRQGRSDPGRVDPRPGSVRRRHVTPRTADLVGDGLSLIEDVPLAVEFRGCGAAGAGVPGDRIGQFLTTARSIAEVLQ